jgi:glycerate 2-kinase
MPTRTATSLQDSRLVQEALGSMRSDLNYLFSESMKRIDMTNLMTYALSTLGGVLQVGKVSIPLKGKKNVVLIAVGKAALQMCTVTVSALQSALQPEQSLLGIAVGPGDAIALPAFIQHFAGGHPFPNQSSYDAAEAVLEMLAPLGPDDLVIYLISGGASAMLEAPMDPLISCEHLTEFYRALVYSGLPITEINVLRKHASKVKGGRLAVAAAPAQQLSLIISDVPGKALEVVGSGPSLPDRSTVVACREILSRAEVREAMSPEILRYFDGPSLAETAKASDEAFSRNQQVCLLSNDSLLAHVDRLAKFAGYYTEIDISCDDWDYADAAAHLLNKVRALRKKHARVCLISGGELSVKVRDEGGLGGRNQHFLLHCAMSLTESDPLMVLLSAGTDGVDGNSLATGAIVDSFTPGRIAELGLNPLLALERFDSYSVLHALGDAIVTGPTGNNVRDLRVILSTD